VSTLVADRTDVPVAPEGAERLLMLACDAAEAIARDAFRYEAAPGTRRYARVRSAADHDVWVIVWGPGSGIDLHDHGGSAGAFADGQVDRPGGAWGERDGDQLAALTQHGQGAVPALETEIVDVRAQGGVRWFV